MKSFRLSLFVALFCIGIILAPTTPVTALDETQLGNLSTNCASIKVQLKTLQKTDSRMRVYLGSKYEIILTNFMTNLNLRLIKDDYADQELAGLQTTFSSERERFKSDFTAYSQSLESLIGIDCQSEPQKFYDQLEVVRTKRADAQASCDRMREVIDWHRSAVLKLWESLPS